jgi:hypothetical protein
LSTLPLKPSPWELVIPILLGAAIFYLVIGLHVLNPYSINWLLNGGDGMQHYLGWVFYRNSEWAFPIGVNLDYGIGMNNSIVFTDSLPLFAVLFKLIRSFLPNPFQFFGIWILIAFILQSIFAWKLIRLYALNVVVLVLGSGLFLFAQPFLIQLPENGPIGSQFLLLWALYLNLKPNKESDLRWWTCLLLIALSVHFYIFAMVTALWSAYLLDGIFRSRAINLKVAIRSSVITLFLCAFVFWQLGYFSTGGSDAFGFGIFKSNLIGLFNPAGWSYILKDLYPSKTWWGEQPHYLGLGIIAGLAITLLHPSSWQKLIKRNCVQRIFFVIVILVLAFFSLSNVIAIGSKEFEYPLFPEILSLFGIFRNSSRFIWPLYYLIFIAVIHQICSKYSANFAIGILAACFALQAADTSAGWLPIRKRSLETQPGFYEKSPLQNSFWKIAPSIYQNVVILSSVENPSPDLMSRMSSNVWKIFGLYAGRNGMAINSNYLYFARFNDKLELKVASKQVDDIAAGKTDPKTLYIIPEDRVGLASCLTTLDPRHSLGRLDGYLVLAPSLNKLNADAAKVFPLLTKPSQPKLGERINFQEFDHPTTSYILCNGWSKLESWGVWANGGSAKIYLSLPKEGARRIELNFRALVNEQHPKQIFQIKLDDSLGYEFEFSNASSNKVLINLSTKNIKDGFVVLEFNFKNPVQPSQIGFKNQDKRLLSIGIESAVFLK